MPRLKFTPGGEWRQRLADGIDPITAKRADRAAEDDGSGVLVHRRGPPAPRAPWRFGCGAGARTVWRARLSRRETQAVQ